MSMRPPSAASLSRRRFARTALRGGWAAILEQCRGKVHSQAQGNPLQRAWIATHCPRRIATRRNKRHCHGSRRCILSPVVQFAIVATTNDAKGLLLCCTLFAAMAVVKVHATVCSKHSKRLALAMLLPLICSAAAFSIDNEVPVERVKPVPPDRAQCDTIARPKLDWAGSTIEACPRHISASFYFVHDTGPQADTQWPRRAFRASRNARMGKLNHYRLEISTGRTLKKSSAIFI